MNIETRKLQLIEKLAKLDNEQLLASIERLVSETTRERYARELGSGQKDALIQMVKEGEDDIAAGNTYTSDEVAAYFKKKRQ